jgi:hypothetical protein
MRVHANKATTEQLRNDVDSGRTGDKIPFPDPAAAPLGTDEEAAGRPTDPHTVERTRRAERARADRSGASHQRRPIARWAPWAIAVVITVLAIWLLVL